MAQKTADGYIVILVKSCETDLVIVATTLSRQQYYNTIDKLFLPEFLVQSYEKSSESGFFVLKEYRPKYISLSEIKAFEENCLNHVQALKVFQFLQQLLDYLENGYCECMKREPCKCFECLKEINEYQKLCEEKHLCGHDKNRWIWQELQPETKLSGDFEFVRVCDILKTIVSKCDNQTKYLVIIESDTYL